MKPGTEYTKLDGINLEWFNTSATYIREGRFKFSPARQILIPKQTRRVFCFLFFFLFFLFFVQATSYCKPSTYDYKSKPHAIFENPEEITDNVLKTSWAGKLTKGLPSKCVLCGTSVGIEMHHLIKVADVRNKIRTGNSTWDQWKGAVARKQIPLCKCKYHHDILHQGNLNHSDLRLIASYQGERES